MSVNMNTFWSDLGVINGNSSATNQYELFNGLTFSDGFVSSSQYDFFTKLGTNRYEFFKSYNSVDSNIIDETTFYQNTSDPLIYDYKTFYERAGSYISAGPLPGPTITYIGTVNEFAAVPKTIFNFNAVPTGGPGLIVGLISYKSLNVGATNAIFNTVTIGGGSATLITQVQLRNSDLKPFGGALIQRRLSSGNFANISFQFQNPTDFVTMDIYNIQNNVSDNQPWEAPGVTQSNPYSVTSPGIVTIPQYSVGLLGVQAIFTGSGNSIIYTGFTEQHSTYETATDLLTSTATDKLLTAGQKTFTFSSTPNGWFEDGTFIYSYWI